MKSTVKVGIFFGIIVGIAIIIAIFAFSRSGGNSSNSIVEYEKNIQLLNDTIKELRDEIAHYQSEIERIDLERKKIKKQIELLIKENEKIDSQLVNGTWDDNIQFLSEFLSEEDSLGD